MFPAVTPQAIFGLPKTRNASTLVQSGCAIIPTRKPCASNVRPIMPEQNDGWSIYASPQTKIKSQLSQPSWSISSRDIGKNGAGSKHDAQYLS